MPGGLPVWRARWFLFWFRGRVVRNALKRLLVLGLPVAAGLLAWSDGHHVGLAVPTVVLTGAVAAARWPRTGRRFRWGAAVTPQTQPTLYALVERVAATLDSPLPDLVWLVHEPIVRSHLAGGRRHLWIGLPLVSCVTRAQLEALVAHELAVLRYEHAPLVLRLRFACMKDRDDRERRGRGAERSLLREFWSTVEDDADAAATRLAGADVAAAAFVTVGLVGPEFLAYSVDQNAPERRTGILDLFEGWPHYVEHGDPDHTDEDGHEQVGRWHTALADPVSRVGQVRLRLAADRVALAPLAEADRRLLVRYAQGLPARRAVHWYTFATAPPQWSMRQAEEDVDDLRRVTGAADDTGLLASLEAAGYEPGLRACAQWRLMAAGWRVERPPVRSVLISPAGERVDLTRLTNQELRALASGWASSRSGVDRA